MYRDAPADKPRRSKYFWSPVWIVLGGCAGIVMFCSGAFVVQAQRSDEDKAALAVAAMRNSSEALEEAETLLLADRIDFSVYRDLVRVA